MWRKSPERQPCPKSRDSAFVMFASLPRADGSNHRTTPAQRLAIVLYLHYNTSQHLYDSCSRHHHDAHPQPTIAIHHRYPLSNMAMSWHTARRRPLVARLSASSLRISQGLWRAGCTAALLQHRRRFPAAIGVLLRPALAAVGGACHDMRT